MHRTAVSLAAVAALLFSTFGGGEARGAGEPPPREEGAPAASKEKPAAASPGRLTRHGVVVDFQVRPAEGLRDRGLVAGQLAEVRFKLQDEATGKPVRGITPGAWMDIGQPAPGSEEASQKSCKDRIALYLKGAVGMRPMIDLNGYYVLVLNREPSISVVDPLVSMVGQTSTLGTIPLKGAGSDWARSADRKRLYVSMPQAGEVAVVDVESFKVHRTIQAGPDPARVALQPDGRYLWVGNDARATDNSGVTVVDVETLEPAARLATGPGHHEIAFTGDSRYAFVSNREAGTVTVVDVAAKRKIKDVSTGPMPIALAWSPLAGALYVADGRDGSVSVLDGNTHEVTARIGLKPGLGPMRFTDDGRFGMVVNPSDNAVYVFDAAENALVHALEVRGRPYQIALSPAFAYVRALDSERVTMINLSTLGKGRQPIVQGFAAGAAAPRDAGDLPLADSIAPLTGEAAVLVVSPGDHTTYFYMEGMNAPASNYKVRGAQARAVTVIDRSLVEVEPGVYAAKVRIPAAGRYDVAFLLDSPQILHCFSVEAKPDPQAKTGRAALKVEYPARDRTAAAGGTFPLRFTLRDLATGDPRTGLADVRVMYFLAPGRNRTEVRAREVGDGLYEALLPVAWPGAYYVHVAVPSEKVGFDDLPYFTMMVTGAAAPPKVKPKAGETE
jgi:YVTN family beta-propeller protein